MGNPEGKQKNHTVLVIVLALIVGCMATAVALAAILLPPAIQQAREARRRQQAAENLRQLKIAVENYHERHAAETDASPAGPGRAAGVGNAGPPDVEGTDAGRNALK